MELKPKTKSVTNNIKKSFEEFIEKHGYYVIIARPMKPIRCECWNSQTQESSPTCNRCLGIGYRLRYERHKVRSSHSTQDSIADSLYYLSTGPQAEPRSVFYFRRNSFISKGMFIIEVDWKGKTPIRSSVNAYEMTHVEIIRGKYGEITYLVAGARNRPELSSRFKDVKIDELKVVDK